MFCFDPVLSWAFPGVDLPHCRPYPVPRCRCTSRLTREVVPSMHLEGKQTVVSCFAYFSHFCSILVQLPLRLSGHHIIYPHLKSSLHLFLTSSVLCRFLQPQPLLFVTIRLQFSPHLLAQFITIISSYLLSFGFEESFPAFLMQLTSILYLP